MCFCLSFSNKITFKCYFIHHGCTHLVALLNHLENCMSVSLFMFDIDISGTRYFVAYIQ